MEIIKTYKPAYFWLMFLKATFFVSFYLINNNLQNTYI
jgi:hypothetical protein